MLTKGLHQYINSSSNYGFIIQGGGFTPDYIPKTKKHIKNESQVIREQPSYGTNTSKHSATTQFY